MILSYAAFALLVLMASRPNGEVEGGLTKRLSEDDVIPMIRPPLPIPGPDDPCKFAFCANNPTASCRPSRSDTTKAEFVDGEGVIKDCGTECKDLCFSRENDPHCGSNGATYASQCALNVDKCKSKGKLSLVSRRECKQLDPCKFGFCANAPHSYCRTKEWDYTKPEFVDLSPDGNLKTIENCGTICKNTCKSASFPVCGSDGKVYENMCELEFAKCKSDGKLALQHNGRCMTGRRSSCEYSFCARFPDAFCRKKKWDVTRPEFYSYGVDGQEIIKNRTDCGTICSKVCNFDFSPVCSTRLQTFSSECELNVAKCEIGGWFGLKHHGKCGLSVHIRSFGTKREKFISTIHINNKSVAKGKRGYNVVVVNERTEKVEASKAFDTHADETAAKAMKNFIQNLGDGKIVAVAIQTDGAAKAGKEVYEALRMIHGEDPFQHHQFEAFAMLGYKGASKPSWAGRVSQVVPRAGMEEEVSLVREIIGEDPDIP